MTNQIARFDTSALNRALVGFDQLFDNFEKRFTNQVSNNYPPHNILKLDADTYEIQVAVTGFDPADISVEVNQNEIVIKGECSKTEDSEVTYIHRGLAGRDFVRTFTLADHMEVGEARIRNGVLKIAIKRVIPEALKPRVLQITTE
jgi:molecular chaperone IbpA